MNKIFMEIDELKSRISHIEFKEILSDEDWKLVDDLKKELEELQKNIPSDFRGVALYSSKLKCYLTSEVVCCCCNDPTWFDSLEEAQEYLSRARLADGNRESFVPVYYPGE